MSDLVQRIDEVLANQGHYGWPDEAYALLRDLRPLVAAPTPPEGDWHCDADAVGIHWAGICSPENPIHRSSCGWRIPPAAPVVDVTALRGWLRNEIRYLEGIDLSDRGRGALAAYRRTIAALRPSDGA